MKLALNKNLIRKAVLLIVPLGLLGGSSLYAHDPYEDEHARWHHQHDEKRALADHQRQERYYYGNSWAVRQHQREEWQQLREHHEDERSYADRHYNYGRPGDRGHRDRGYRYGGGDSGYYGR